MSGFLPQRRVVTPNDHDHLPGRRRGESHPYSGFNAPLGAIRLSGDSGLGDFGPSKAYPNVDISYKKPLGYGNYDTDVHRNSSSL